MSEVEPAVVPAPPRRRRGALVVGVIAAVAVYLLVVVLYAAGGRDPIDDSYVTPTADEVGVTLSPLSLAGVTERLTLDVRVEAPDTLLDADGTLTRPLTVVVTPSDGSQSIVLAEGDILRSAKSVSLIANGEVENWPFDRYTSKVLVVAYYVDDAGERQGVPVRVNWSGHLSGFDFSAVDDFSLDAGEVAYPDGAVSEVPVIVIDAQRSGSTLAFGFVLLALLVVLPVLSLYVAISAYTGRRKVEATLTSWMGAMLFATVPLRGFLPGSPPVGSWIDFLVVLWVIVGLVAALVIYVLAWNRWGTGPRG